MFTRTADGSIVDENDKVIYFSADRFIDDICEGGCCLICGASPKVVKFDAEHVIPNWVLKKVGLHSQQIGLPNQAWRSYGTYTIPCCADCNRLMGSVFEDPISSLFARGREAIVEHLKSDGPGLLFCWLSLIFLKAHLRDRQYKLHLDHRKGDAPISALYDWSTLHHIHCIARAFFSGVKIDYRVLGSLMVLPAKAGETPEDFDYKDIYETRTILIRIHDVCLLANLTDCCAAYSMLMGGITKLSGELSAVQLREIMSHMAFVDLNLLERPTFRTEAYDGTLIITTELPNTLQLSPDATLSKSKFGKLMFECCKDIVQQYPPAERDGICTSISDGRYTFLTADGKPVFQ